MLEEHQRGHEEILARAEAVLQAALPGLDHPFRQPELTFLGIVAGVG
jgi:hypothetical protein